MGVVEIFISNIFDIYPSEAFIKQFLADNSLDIGKILNHDFLKLSVMYSYIWNIIYKTFPTKKDFINYVEFIKIIPEACPTTYDKAFIENILNTFMHLKLGMVSQFDFNNVFKKIEEFSKNLNDHKFLQNFLFCKWQYRFLNNTPPSNPHILISFIELYKGYESPDIYKYQMNPINNNYNESIIFEENDDTYLNEHEKIQYTIYKDNHYAMKAINQIGILFDAGAAGAVMHDHILTTWLNIFYSNYKDNHVHLFNCTGKHNNDPTCTYTIHPSVIHILPCIFSKFVYVSDKKYPDVRALALSSIYYKRIVDGIFRNEAAVEGEAAVASEAANKMFIQSYDHYIVNRIEDLAIGNAGISNYIIMDPVLKQDKTHDILMGLKTYEAIKDKLIQGYSYAIASPTVKGSYVIDLFNEVDILDHMAKGALPIVKDSIYVKPNITGIKIPDGKSPIDIIRDDSDKIVSDSIRKNIKLIEILRHERMFTYFWKQHLETTCPVRGWTGRNGMIQYFNFCYSYFLKNIDKIAGIDGAAANANATNKVVLLDNRPNPLSVLSVLFTLSNLNITWSCKLYTSAKGLAYYRELLGDFAEVVELPALNVNKFHIDVYNNILKSSEFWKDINAEKTLIIQDDGILLRPGIDRFIEYDYIGASWVDNVGNEYIKKNITEDLVGNGGFSLRTNSQMIRVCDTYVKEKLWLFYKNVTQIPEDVYFIYGLKKLGDCKLPIADLANQFASEQICHMGSLGLHKVWGYHGPDTIKQYFDALLKV